MRGDACLALNIIFVDITPPRTQTKQGLYDWPGMRASTQHKIYKFYFGLASRATR